MLHWLPCVYAAPPLAMMRLQWHAAACLMRSGLLMSDLYTKLLIVK
jgi:hypothetical protein